LPKVSSQYLAELDFEPGSSSRICTVTAMLGWWQETPLLARPLRNILWESELRRYREPVIMRNRQATET